MTGLRIAVAESCTGGLLCGALTESPGASAVFLGGMVVYSDASKRKLLGVPARLLQMHGAVSRQCALAMARGAQHRFGAEVAVAVTGIAGPGGAVRGKPVGTVWFAVASPGALVAGRKRFAGDRNAVRRQAVAHALRMLDNIPAQSEP